MNTNEKGAIGLVNVTADLITRGYEVFVPTTDYSPVDIVVGDKSMNLKRLQIKFRTENKSGSLFVDMSSVVNGKRIQIDESKIDAWAVYCPSTRIIHYVPVCVVKRNSFTIPKGNISYVDPGALWHSASDLPIISRKTNSWKVNQAGA